MTDNKEILEETIVNSEEKPEFTKDQLDMIFRGERPNDIEYPVFKLMRKIMNRYNHEYMKGKLVFISKDLGYIRKEVENAKKNNVPINPFIYKGKTYVKSQINRQENKV